MSQKQAERWIPEICYEDNGDGGTSHIPFIPIPEDQEMPKVLFIFSSRDTGEFEPGSDGEEVPVVELDLHQYADMNTLRDRLPPLLYNNIRLALGLESLESAAEKGREITNSIREKLNPNP